MAYSYQARKSFRCFDKQVGVLLIDIPPDAATFQDRVDRWTEDGTQDDVYDEIEENVTDILSRCKGEITLWRQSVHTLLFDQMIAAEMVIDEISGHLGHLDTFQSCLEEVEEHYESPVKSHKYWPCRLEPYKPIMLSAIEILIEHCMDRKQADFTDSRNEVCLFNSQKSLEKAFLLRPYSPTADIPNVVAELHECFGRLFHHCLDALWIDVREHRLSRQYIDCPCTASLEQIGAACSSKSFRKVEKRNRERMCEALTIVPMTARRLVHGSDIEYSRDVSTGQWSKRRTSPPSNLARYMKVCEYEAGSSG
ncbi:hypothetical protein SCARD494_11581 [Seiridium cardinale]